MHNFYKFIGVAYLFFLVLFTVLTHLDILDLQFYSQIDINQALDTTVKFVLYMINVYFLMLIIVRKFEASHIKYMFFYMVFALPAAFLPDRFNFIPSIVMPFIFVTWLPLLKNVKNLTIKDVLYRYLIFAIITIVVQQLMVFTRFGGFNLSMGHFYTSKQIAIISIDLLMYYYIYYKVVSYRANKSFWRSRLNIFYSKTERVPSDCKNCEKDINLIDLNLRQRIIFIVIAYGYQLLTLGIVLGIGLLNNKIVELMIMLVVFWVGRSILGKSWHSGNLFICSGVTFISFYILTLVQIDLKYTLLGAISLSAIFTWILHKIVEFEDNYKDLDKIKKFIENFDIDKSTEDELIQRCKMAGLSKEDTQLAVELFVSKIKPVDLSQKYHIAVSTLRNKKVLIRKKLLNLY